MTCGKLEYYLGLHVHIHITSKNGDACKLCATEHIFRLIWPQLWRHRSKVRGSGSWNFQEGREKVLGKLYQNWWHSTGKQKKYFWKTAGGCINPPSLCRWGLSLYTNRFVVWQATPCFFPRSSSSLIGKSARLSIFCHFDILSFDILPLRYFATSIFCFRYFAFRYFAPSISCISISCIFDILRFDILQFDILQFRYFAPSIFCAIDILRLRYFVFRYIAFDILRFYILRFDILSWKLNGFPPSISAPAHRRTKRKTAFESSRKIISKSLQSFFGSGQNWGHQGSKFQNFPKWFLDDEIFNFKDRATILIPSCLFRQGASNLV